MAKETLFWLGLLIVFFIVFLLSYINFKQGIGMLNIMPIKIENKIIMGFSVVGILKSLYEMW